MPALKNHFCDVKIILPSHMNSTNITQYIKELDDNVNYVYNIEIHSTVYEKRYTPTGYNIQLCDNYANIDEIYINVPSYIATILKMGYEGIMIVEQRKK